MSISHSRARFNESIYLKQEKRSFFHVSNATTTVGKNIIGQNESLYGRLHVRDSDEQSHSAER